MSLHSLIARHSRDCVLVRSALGDWTTDRVLQSAASIRKSVYGMRVAVRIADAGEGLRTIALLDGAAAAVVLVPAATPVSQLSHLLELAGVQVVVADNADEIRGLGCASVVKRIEDVVGVEEQAPQKTAWILATSGTSGEPKLVSHTFETLVRTTKTASQVDSAICWGLLYEWPRFAGLQVLLQSALSGNTLIAPAATRTLNECIDLFFRSACTHLSATPTMWRKIAMTPGADRLPLRQISLGGEIVDDRTLSTLRTIFPKARITHIYASTEAGVGFSVNDCRAGFPVSYLTHPPAGVSLRVVNSRLHVLNREVVPTYMGTTRSFGSDDGWIDTDDTVRIENDRVYFLGRGSGVINVAGNKVHPEEVEQVLLQCSGVVAARVFGKSSAITGSVVVAEVVFEPSPENSAVPTRTLQRHVASILEAYKVPVVISPVTEIECNSTGKTARALP